MVEGDGWEGGAGGEEGMGIERSRGTSQEVVE